MKTYFNGCSFTYGDELENPMQDSWPVLTASKLNFEFLNDAVPGGTNDRIMYKTIQNIGNYDCFIIAWTTYTRFTEYNPVDNFEINFTPVLKIDVSAHYSDDLKNNYKKFKDYGTMYYKYWFNEIFEFKKWLQQIILLQTFFKSNNKSYIMLNTFSNNLENFLQPHSRFINATKHLIQFFDYINDDQLLNECTQIQNLNSLIDKSKFIRWNNWSIKDLKSTYKYGPGGHLLEDGHVAITDIVTDFYNKTYDSNSRSHS